MTQHRQSCADLIMMEMHMMMMIIITQSLHHGMGLSRCDNVHLNDVFIVSDLLQPMSHAATAAHDTKVPYLMTQASF